MAAVSRDNRNVARWLGDLTEAQLDAISARNKASRVHKFEGSNPELSKITVATKRARDAQAAKQRNLSREPATDAAYPPKFKDSGHSRPTLTPQLRRKRIKWKEARVLADCIFVLESHPAVACWWRQNTGAVTLPGKKKPRFVRFSFKGASDLMGVLRGGRFLACECKATGEEPTPNQQAFLDNVRDAGGLALWVDDPATLFEALQAIVRGGGAAD